ncbi:hypothetical protein [Sphingomonas sp.]|uniref:hypothetical protein n=1 Tax=Sphingomonas sp. TaxID=28214 RepID=UPI001D7ADA0B|nr:hypothetical protein [Sphingomonas sp.]MBX9796692.1 hypothetical protein [Sphingomonas sp.]
MAPRITTNPDRADALWRATAYHLATLQLTTVQAFGSGALKLGPVELQICLTVAVANVQKLMRERTLPPEYGGKDRLPDDLVVPISRNAIASATGLPRETVRRQVEKLIGRGVLVEDPRGGVRTVPDTINQLGLASVLEPMLTEFSRVAEALLRLGVIELHAD